MSRTMSIFFNSGKSFKDTLGDLEQALQIFFDRAQDSEDELYEYVGFGISATVLKDHGMVDDLGISFTMYEYHLQFHAVRSFSEPDYSLEIQYYSTLYAHDCIARKLGYRSIVVENLQKQIRSYPE